MATDAAPEPPAETPAPAVSRRLSEELANLQATFAEREVQLHEVISILKGRAYILLLILLSLPFCTPIPVPVSTPFGFVVALIALRLTLGQKPFLPKRLLNAKLPPGFFGKLIAFTKRLVRVLERLLKPRWLVVTDSSTLQRFHAFVMFIAGLVLLLPMPVPFTNTFPAWTILLIACGLLERDGLAIFCGYLVFVLGVFYFVLLGKSAQEIIELLKSIWA